MTTEQAFAILEAERVLQVVGCDGPDTRPGTPWKDYVKKAGDIIKNDKFLYPFCDGLHLLEDSNG